MPVMSVGEARAILGESGIGQTDEQIEKLFGYLDGVTHAFLHSYFLGKIIIPSVSDPTKSQ